MADMRSEIADIKTEVHGIKESIQGMEKMFNLYIKLDTKK